MSEGFSNSAANRSLQRAVRHVNSLWLPINQNILKQLKTNLEFENFKDQDAALNFAKKDPNLFLYLKKSLGCSRENSLEKLIEVINVEVSGLNAHSLEEPQEFQAVEYDKQLIEISAAISLSESFGVKTDKAYELMLFQQLGKALIAWNYPKTYKESLMEVRPSLPLNTILQEKLGFSPELLALEVIKSWSLHDEESALDSARIAQKEDAISDLLLVSESLAKANHPECFPSASKDWALAKSEIISKLGEHGLKAIEAKYLSFISSLPVQLSVAKSCSLNAEEKINSATALRYTVPSIFFTLPKPLRYELQGVYEELNSKPKDLLLKRVLSESLKSSSFDGISVYTYDPIGNILKRQFHGGNTHFIKSEVHLDGLERGEKLSTLFLSSINEVSGTIESNLQEGRSYVAVPLYVHRKVGVVYAEGDFLCNELVTGSHRLELECIALTLTDILLV